jgi:tetratricopeptide (TPR) repeat protein
VVTCAAVLSACAGLPGGTAPPPVATPPAGGPGAAQRPSPAASNSLLEQSRRERDAGRYGEATAVVERALRIEPNNPWLWIELGEIKREEGDLAQAEAMARKALTLAGGDRNIEARAFALIDR